MLCCEAKTHGHTPGIILPPLLPSQRSQQPLDIIGQIKASIEEQLGEFQRDVIAQLRTINLLLVQSLSAEWTIVLDEKVNVRERASLDAPSIGSKNPGEIIQGCDLGDWVALVGEPGYIIKVTKAGEPVLETKVRRDTSKQTCNGQCHSSLFLEHTELPGEPKRTPQTEAGLTMSDTRIQSARTESLKDTVIKAASTVPESRRPSQIFTPAQAPDLMSKQTSVATKEIVQTDKKTEATNRFKVDPAKITNVLCISEELHDQEIVRVQSSMIGRWSLLLEELRDMTKTMDGFDIIFDVLIGTVIVLNAICMGFEMQYNREVYPEWHHHKVFLFINVGMCLIFVTELIVKLKVHGCAEIYFGSDRYMNCFDSTIVFADVFMLILDVTEALLEIPVSPSLFRLVRLVRLCRLLRVIRLTAFNDLLAMIQGIIGGLLTLTWAMVLLLVLVYFFSLIFLVLVGEAQIENVSIYFNDVPRAFLTTYRCSFGDCTTVNGTPLFEHLYDDSTGRLLVILYGGFSFFFWVGLFNVISAIFVESTMSAAAKLSSSKKTERMDNNALWATCISSLIQIIWEHTGHSNFPGAHLSERIDEVMALDVPCDIVKEALLQPAARQILLDLDVAWEDHEHLDDVLDPDNGGTIGVLDLMIGLGRVRGDPRRSDIVTVDLMIRVVQRSIIDLHDDVKLVKEAMKQRTT